MIDKIMCVLCREDFDKTECRFLPITETYLCEKCQREFDKKCEEHLNAPSTKSYRNREMLSAAKSNPKSNPNEDLDKEIHDAWMKGW